MKQRKKRESAKNLASMTTADSKKCSKIFCMFLSTLRFDVGGAKQANE